MNIYLKVTAGKLGHLSLAVCRLPFAVCRKRDSKSHCCMVILMTCMYKCTLFSFLDVQSPKGGSPIEGK